MFEHLDGNPVEFVMSRARAILVSLIPALLLAALVNGLGELVTCCACDHPGSSLCSSGHSRHDNPPANDSFDQAVQRWSRRLNVQPGADGFTPPATLAQAQFALPDRSITPVILPRLNPELTQGWQFHWRTVLEPRAPSLVS
jgi:hypothetical protein